MKYILQGKTFENKEEIKKAGFVWNANEKLWTSDNFIDIQIEGVEMIEYTEFKANLAKQEEKIFQILEDYHNAFEKALDEHKTSKFTFDFVARVLDIFPALQNNAKKSKQTACDILHTYQEYRFFKGYRQDSTPYQIAYEELHKRVQEIVNYANK